MKKMNTQPILTFCKYFGTVVVVLFFLCSSLPAQEMSAQEMQAREMSDGQMSPAEPVGEKAPVIVNGKVLFSVLGVSVYPAKERAQTIARRISQAAADESIDPKKMKVVQAGKIVEIYIGKHMLLGLAPSDAASEGISLDILTDLVQEKIRLAIGEYRYERTPRVLLIKTGYALFATLVVALLIWGILRFFSWFRDLAESRITSRIKKLESKSRYLIRAEMLLGVLAGTLRTAKILIVIIVSYIYVNLVLGLYPWTRLFAGRLFSIVLEPLRIMGLGIISQIPNLVFLVILYFVFRYFLKLARLFFAGIERGRITLANFEREWALPTYRIVRLMMIVFALVVAYPYIPGSGSEAFKGISIFLGVIFSLGSSSVLSHIIAGYSLTYRRAFKIGDRVKIDDIIGDIEDMRFLVTRVRSLKNEEVVIPNSIILNSSIVNYSSQIREQGLILHTTVGIGYEVPWRQVEAMLLLAADRTPGLRKEPRPFVLQKSLGDFAVNYEINGYCYCDDASQMMQIYTELHRNILDVFNEYGVQIMTPNYESDTEQPKVVARDQWYAPPAVDGTGQGNE